MLARLAAALQTSGDFLIDGIADERAAGQLADAGLLARFRQVEQLPEEDRSVIKQLIDAFVTKHEIQRLLA